MEPLPSEKTPVAPLASWRSPLALLFVVLAAAALTVVLWPAMSRRRIAARDGGAARRPGWRCPPAELLISWLDDPALVLGQLYPTGCRRRANAGPLTGGRPATGLVVTVSALATALYFTPANWPPLIAALSMSGSSFIVAVNALMLKRARLPEIPEG